MILSGDQLKLQQVSGNSEQYWSTCSYTLLDEEEIATYNLHFGHFRITIYVYSHFSKQ